MSGLCDLEPVFLSLGLLLCTTEEWYLLPRAILRINGIM